MKNYSHIFFDLDRTLWDFDANTASTLREIIENFQLKDRIPGTSLFIETYEKHNNFVWELYKKRQITKHALRTERFRLLFKNFNIYDEVLIDEVNRFYMLNSPNKSGLIDGAIEVLEYLHKQYDLHIISNGFYDSQYIKLKASKINHYFKTIYTSDKVGAAKPNKAIFEYAIASSNARKRESIFIGDDVQIDIAGAQNCNIDQIWFNPNDLITDIIPTYEVNHLKKIKDIL